MSRFQPGENLRTRMTVTVPQPYRNHSKLRMHCSEKLRHGGSVASVMAHFEQIGLRLLFCNLQSSDAFSASPSSKAEVFRR